MLWCSQTRRGPLQLMVVQWDSLRVSTESDRKIDLSLRLFSTCCETVAVLCEVWEELSAFILASAALNSLWLWATPLTAYMSSTSAAAFS